MPEDSGTQDKQTGFVQENGFSQQNDKLSSEVNSSQPNQPTPLSQSSETQQGFVGGVQGQSDLQPTTLQQQEPFLQKNTSVEQPTTSSDSISKVDNESQKTILFLALIFFVFSLVGLSFYLFSGITKGRFSLSSLFSGGQRFVTPQPTAMVISETPTPQPVIENLVYADEVLSFEYPQGMSVVRKVNSWVIGEVSSKLPENATGSANVVFEVVIIDSDAKNEPIEYLIGEITKTDKKINKSILEELISNEKIGNYNVYSYKFADSSVVYVFEENLSKRLVKVVDFSSRTSSDLKEYDAKYLISKIRFVDSSNKQSPSPSLLPSPKPTSGRFNLGE